MRRLTRKEAKLMSKVRKKLVRSSGDRSLEDVLKMVGTSMLRRHENIFYGVIIRAIRQVGCGLKAEVEPIDGVGSEEVCLTELVGYDEANDLLRDEETLAKVRMSVEEITGLHYRKDRRAAFALMIEKHVPEEEAAKIAEEYPGSAGVPDHAIRTICWRVFRRVHGLIETGEEG